jgi:hypothetical protein
MAQFLDLRTSENSNTPGSPGTTLSTSAAAPSFIGDIGLIVGTVTSIRVDLWGTIGLLKGDGAATVELFIARNLSPTSVFVAANVIYTAEVTLMAGDNGPLVVNINAADLLGTPGPVPEQINYSLFALNLTAGNAVTRNGPEVFTGIAANG